MTRAATYPSRCFSLLFVAGLALAIGCASEPADLETRMAIVRRWGVDLATDSARTPLDRIDMRALSIPESVSVVMLGEQTHGDGSTFLLKTALIRHLHRNLGFRILVFESSAFDCAEADRALAGGADAHQVFRSCLFDVWADSRELQPLMAYVDANRDDLTLAGMDAQFSGSLFWRQRSSSLIAQARQVLGAPDSLAFAPTLELLRDSTLFRQVPDSTRRAEVKTSLETLGRVLAVRSDGSYPQELLARTLHQLPAMLDLVWSIRRNRFNARKANVRDSLMAANLLWLSRDIFPGEKFIVWGANSHLSHYREGLTHGDEMMPMGSRIRSEIGHTVFTVLFTSYQGERGLRDGTILPTPRASRIGFEYAAHRAGARLAWFDFKRLEPGNPFLSPFKARFFGFADKEGQWSEMTDGFLFIDSMIPNTRRAPALSGAANE